MANTWWQTQDNTTEESLPPLSCLGRKNSPDNFEWMVRQEDDRGRSWVVNKQMHVKKKRWHTRLPREMQRLILHTPIGPECIDHHESACNPAKRRVFMWILGEAIPSNVRVTFNIFLEGLGNGEEFVSGRQVGVRGLEEWEGEEHHVPHTAGRNSHSPVIGKWKFTTWKKSA